MFGFFRELKQGTCVNPPADFGVNAIVYKVLPDDGSEFEDPIRMADLAKVLVQQGLALEFKSVAGIPVKDEQGCYHFQERGMKHVGLGQKILDANGFDVRLVFI